PIVVFGGGETEGRRSVVNPDERVDGFRQHIDGKQDAGDAGQQDEDAVLYQAFAGDFLHYPGGENEEAGAHGGGGNDEEEEGEEGADAGQDVDQLVHFELEDQKRGDFAQFAVLEHNGQVLDEEDGEVATDAEGDLGEHGVHVGIPEGEPGAERLSDIHHERGH